MPKDIREKKPDSIREILEELLMGYIKEVKINQALTRIRQILLEELGKKKGKDLYCGEYQRIKNRGYNQSLLETQATIKRLTE